MGTPGPGGGVSWDAMASHVGQQVEAIRRDLAAFDQRHHSDLMALRQDLIRDGVSLEDRFTGHEDWHRQQMSGAADRAPQLTISRFMAVITVLSMVATIVLALYAHR